MFSATKLILHAVDANAMESPANTATRHKMTVTNPRIIRTKPADTSNSSQGGTPPYIGVEAANTLLESTERRLLELRFLHHYFSSTAATFPATHQKQVIDTWTIEVPKLAFEHNYLLQAVLAVSALHLTMLHPDHQEYAQAHRTYLNAAVREHRKEVSRMNPSNADLVALTAILIAYQAFALLQEQPSGDDFAEYSPPMQWLYISNGIRTIVSETRPWLRAMPDAEVNAVSIFSKPHLFDREALFQEKYAEPFASLLTWNPPSPLSHTSAVGNFATDENESPIPTPDDAKAYQQTLSYIGTIYDGIHNHEPKLILHRRILALGPIIPRRFIELLTQLRPRALVILAHFFALTKEVEDLWWYDGVAKREVEGLRSIIPQEWQWAMEWPLTMIEATSVSTSNGV